MVKIALDSDSLRKLIKVSIAMKLFNDIYGSLLAATAAAEDESDIELVIAEAVDAFSLEAAEGGPEDLGLIELADILDNNVTVTNHYMGIVATRINERINQRLGERIDDEFGPKGGN